MNFQSINRWINNKIPPKVTNENKLNPINAKLSDKFKKIYIPFIGFSEDDCYKYSYGSLKFTIPAKYLNGKSPLKTGFIWSIKAKEKYVNWITVTISKVITFPALKSRDVATVNKAIPVTA